MQNDKKGQKENILLDTILKRLLKNSFNYATLTFITHKTILLITKQISLLQKRYNFSVILQFLS